MPQGTKFSVRNFAASLAYLGIICCAALSLLFFPGLAFPRDLDGKYENSPLKWWFDSLASRRGFCCSFADGQSVEDVDWDTKDGKYRVRLDSQWIEVPPDALVTAPNKFGLAVVWPYKDYEGRTQIRCFIPGAGGNDLKRECPLLGVKRTWHFAAQMSAYAQEQ